MRKDQEGRGWDVDMQGFQNAFTFTYSYRTTKKKSHNLL